MKDGHYISSDNQHIISHDSGFSMRFYKENGQDKYEYAERGPKKWGYSLSYGSGNLEKAKFSRFKDLSSNLNDRYEKSFNSAVQEYKDYLKRK